MKALGFQFDGRFYFESPKRWNSNRILTLEIEGNTVDSIDPDGEYDFKFELRYDVESGKVIAVLPLKKALAPPSQN
jgi:hypothetical protein